VSAAAPLRFDVATATDIGRRRRRNEDMVLAMPEHGVFLLADGMGGGAAGDVASRAACFYIRDALTARSPGAPLPLSDTVAVIRDATNRSSKWIRTITPQLGARIIGTTLIALVFDPEQPARAVALHAGDSRLYRWRTRHLEPLTVDHSAANSLGIQELQDLPASMRGMITRAVGVRDEVELEETELSVLPDDLFLLCSDGFYNMVAAPDAAPLFLAHGGAVEALAASMIEAANHAGGYDNISVALVRRHPGA
jgi:serine/threonine protein phosphatase PrpC